MNLKRDTEGLPTLPHLGSEFMLWLWYESEQTGGQFAFTTPQEGDEVELGALGSVELWVDERIALRNRNDTRISAVLTGMNPSTTLESRAALAGGKVCQELRVGIRSDDREFFVTLKGPALWSHSAALPQVVSGLGEGWEGTVLDRLALIEEMDMLIGLLFNEYCTRRLSASWAETFDKLSRWVLGEEGEREVDQD